MAKRRLFGPARIYTAEKLYRSFRESTKSVRGVLANNRAIAQILRVPEAQLIKDTVLLLQSMAHKPCGLQDVLLSRLPSSLAPRAAKGGGLRDPVVEAWKPRRPANEQPPSGAQRRPASERPPITQELVAEVAARIEKASPEMLARSFGGIQASQFLHYVLSLLDISAFAKAGVEGRVHTRGGLVVEAAMPFRSEVLRAEKAAALANVEDLLARMGKRHLGEKASAALEHAFDGVKRDGGASFKEMLKGTAACGDSVRLAPNLWLMRLTGLTDDAGKQVLDHFRGLVWYDVKNGAVEIVPVGLGESKFKGGTYVIVDQIKRSFGRIKNKLSAAELPVPPNVKVRVRWGKEVAAVFQTELRLADTQIGGLEAAVQTASEAKAIKVRTVRVDGKQAAEDARAIVRAIIDVLLKFDKPAK